MDIQNLVHMANRIGDFFQSMPDRAEAKHDIADHIRKFWEPRMREALISHLDTPTTADLHDLVREAVKDNLSMLTPKKSTA